MKKLLVGFTFLVSFASFASECNIGYSYEGIAFNKDFGERVYQRVERAVNQGGLTINTELSRQNADVLVHVNFDEVERAEMSAVYNIQALVIGENNTLDSSIYEIAGANVTWNERMADPRVHFQYQAQMGGGLFNTVGVYFAEKRARRISESGADSNIDYSNEELSGLVESLRTKCNSLSN